MYSVADLPCIQLNCGEFGTCDTEGGKCNCTYDNVYSGAQCRDCEYSTVVFTLPYSQLTSIIFALPVVGCEHSPCGSRGDCVEPSDPSEETYACRCRNKTHVQGKDCDGMSTTQSGHLYCIAGNSLGVQ